MESKKYVDFDKVITTYKTFGHLNLHNALEAFNEIPAANVRPVVHGFNLDKNYPSLFECSVCGWFDGDTTTGNTRTYNFCPNCGADMREIINE